VNVLEALRQGRRLLPPVSEEPMLEAELLLRHCLRLDRTSLYSRLSSELSADQEQSYRELIRRRLIHEPTPYILGHKEFFGLEFEVAPAAIIPRPETELLVELALDHVHKRALEAGLRIADVGTGCGCIAVSLAKALTGAEIVAIDPSEEALELAHRNAARHGVARRITFACCDLMDALAEPVDLIVANLPYIPTSEWRALRPEIKDHEPRLGLDGGSDGLREIGRLLQQAPARMNPSGVLLAEIGDRQGAAAKASARAAFPRSSYLVPHRHD
jgi:release factor glutamine methyltransferase